MSNIRVSRFHAAGGHPAFRSIGRRANLRHRRPPQPFRAEHAVGLRDA
jgi:hypothetical protein